MSKNSGKEEVVEAPEVPLSAELKALARRIDELKLLFYPEGRNMSKVYSDQAPGKKDFISVRKKINELAKVASVQERKRARKETTAADKPKKKLRMVKIHDDLAEFLHCEEKGLKDGVYSDTLLTSYLTNYAYYHKMKKGSYIIPDARWVKLFSDSLHENGIINSKGDLLKRRTPKGDEFQGIQFTEVQKLIKTKVVTVYDPMKKEDKYQIIPIQGNEELSAIIEEERGQQLEYTKLRKRATELEGLIAEREKLLPIAQKHGDEDELSDEIGTLKTELKKVTKTLKEQGSRYFA